MCVVGRFASLPKLKVVAKKLNGNAPIPKETCNPSNPPKPNKF